MNNLNLKTLTTGLSFAVLIFGGSCKKDVSQLKAEPLKRPANIAGITNTIYGPVGFGYDVTTEYARPTSIRTQVINVEKLNADFPSRVTIDPSVSESTDIQVGSNSVDFSSKMTSKFTYATDFLLFGGTINASFKDSSKTSSKYSYAYFSQYIKQRSVRITATNDFFIANYLTDAFKYDINAMSPQELVSNYGTHILTAVILGSKLELTYRSQTNSSDKTKSIVAGITANGIKKFFSLTTDYTYDETLAKTNTNQSLSYRTEGGDGTKGPVGEIVNLDKADPNQIGKVSITDWRNTCNANNAVLIDLVRDGAIPIYDLISDPVKKEAVRTYVLQYLGSHQARTRGDVPIYVYNNQRYADHYFTPDNQPAIGGGSYVNEGIAFYAFQGQAIGTVPIYVYNNQKVGDHYFTSENQPTIGGGDFKNEGVAFYAYSTPAPDRIPVYVYYNQKLTDHYFSTDFASAIGNGDYKYEAIAFYVTN